MEEAPAAWRVLVEMQGPAHADLDPGDDRVESLFNLLFDGYGAAMAVGGNELCVRLTVEGDDMVTDSRAAAVRGRNIVIEAMHGVGLEPWPVVTLRAGTFDEHGPRRQPVGAAQDVTSDLSYQPDQGCREPGYAPAESA